jgi:hypothetical protein
MNAGIIYAVKSIQKERKLTRRHSYDGSGEDYIDMCKYSISTLRKVSRLPITICTEKSLFKDFSNLNVNLVEIPQKRAAPHKNDLIDTGCKFFALESMFYDINIFIDADTEILRDPLEAYDEKYDIQGARELDVNLENFTYNGLKQQFNSGFLVYKRDEAIKKLFSAAEELYRLGTIKDNNMDQNCINHIIFYNGKIKTKVGFLDPRWNVRPGNYWQIPDPYILHMKYLDPEDEKDKEWLAWR